MLNGPVYVIGAGLLGAGLFGVEMPLWERPWWYWLLLIGGNIPVYLLIGRAIFRTREDFYEAVRYYFQPDWMSMIRGEWGEDSYATLKLTALIVLSAAAVLAEHVFLFG